VAVVVAEVMAAATSLKCDAFEESTTQNSQIKNCYLSTEWCWVRDRCGHLMDCWCLSDVHSASSECKLLLWWFEIIALCLRQIDFGAEHRRVVRVLLSIVPALMSHGEDKSSAGLLGAIGFGRRSSLSHRWLVCICSDSRSSV